MEDQMKLFDGNVHPSEYWLRELESFNEDSFACQDYSLGTTVLLDAVEGQWHQCALLSSFRALFADTFYAQILRCYQARRLTVLRDHLDQHHAHLLRLVTQLKGRQGRQEETWNQEEKFARNILEGLSARLRESRRR
ncbi:hypothetical protein BDP67DRAFT_499741 [Colletotrichum lupini]|nr:hypothetical protein BDP67DRAFT_499741 [Colletotrichum lupini]